MNSLATSIRVVAIALLVASSLAHAESNWPHWRGPKGDGHAVEKNVPTQWDASSVIWKTALKGNGQSSPIIWGDRMFLTTALEDGKQRVVFCVSTKDGKILWEHTAWTGLPEPSHKMNGWASATCATDGEIVVAFFGKGGIHAYSVDGKPLWSKDLGGFESPWGTAACPVIVGELVIQNGDSDKDAFIEAFDRKTGSSVWRKKRPDNRGWSTPIVLRRGGREELVLNGHTGVTAYNPADGSELWFTRNSNGRGEPTVTSGSGLLFVVCGLAGDMYALRPGDSSTQPQTAWVAPRRGGRDLPSPIVVGKYVIVSRLDGITTCYDVESGKEFWRERLNGQFSSSPIAVDGLVLHQNEAGETYVIEPGPTLKIVGQNKLGSSPDELFRASLTPAEGRMYSRSTKVLYCIGKK